MCSFFDSEVLLLVNDQWTKLDEKWGKPVDLETEDDNQPMRLQPVISTLNLTTFDSAPIVKRLHQKATSRPELDYDEFLQNLQGVLPYRNNFVEAHTFSAASVEEICKKIDNMFKSVEKLSSATSTIRGKSVADVISCSMSVDGLSFDDTEDITETYDIVEEEEQEDSIEACIEDALMQLSELSKSCLTIDERETQETVTTLVRKFASVLAKPLSSCSPRKKRQFSTKFQDLVQFWDNLDSQS